MAVYMKKTFALKYIVYFSNLKNGLWYLEIKFCENNKKKKNSDIYTIYNNI